MDRFDAVFFRSDAILADQEKVLKNTFLEPVHGSIADFIGKSAIELLNRNLANFHDRHLGVISLFEYRGLKEVPMPPKKILVIDDDPDILELLEYNLKKEGFAVVTAPSGLSAMWGLEEDSRPDVVLLDLMLPTLDGYELCKFLKNSDEFRKVPVIIVSAKGGPEDIRKGLALGADAYLPKASFTMRSLIEEVRKVV